MFLIPYLLEVRNIERTGFIIEKLKNINFTDYEYISISKKRKIQPIKTMAKKRKTLPKDFVEILKRGDIQEIINVFDKCEIDAYGGYDKLTAIAFPECPPELDKWLVEKGLDIEAVNDYGYTPLQHRAEYWSANIKSLIDLGADININNKNGTALHCAAKKILHNM